MWAARWGKGLSAGPVEEYAWGMSDSASTGLARPQQVDVTVRSYRPTDHGACRGLWAELVEQHQELYHEKAAGGPDQGAAFEEYLTRLDLSGMWVAEDAEGTVVGFTGLLLQGRSGEVDPLVVTGSHRGHGVGRALLERVAEEGRRRRLTFLSVSPASRNVGAIHCFYRAGYRAMAHVTLTLDLADRGHEWQDGIDVHNLRFGY